MYTHYTLILTLSFAAAAADDDDDDDYGGDYYYLSQVYLGAFMRAQLLLCVVCVLS